MLNFGILENGPHFVYDFSRKMAFMLYSIN